MPFFVFFPVYFLATLFFINFILSFSFSFHGQSCCFDFVTLSSFCPQKFALSYLVVVSLFCRILFSYVIVQLFLIATRGIFTSFRIQPNQIVEISPSFLFYAIQQNFHSTCYCLSEEYFFGKLFYMSIAELTGPHQKHFDYM